MDEWEIYTKDIKYNSPVLYKIHKLEESFRTLVTNINSFKTQVNTKIDGFEEDLNEMEATITLIQSSFTAINRRLTTAEGDITSLQEQVTALQSSIESLTTQYTALETRLTTAEANISALQSKTNFTIESHTVTEFTADSSISPFDHYVDITLTHTLTENSVVELINDNGINFAKYCFTIISLTNQVVRVACIGQPSSITLKFKIWEE